jgi:hypothetical protein
VLVPGGRNARQYQQGKGGSLAGDHQSRLHRGSLSAVGPFLLQGAADRIDAAYQPKPGQHYKGRANLRVDCIFGSFILERDYYYHEGKKQGH